ncbi:antiviral RADAR system adenosine deaminase RdrB [Escherichia coli]
MLTRSLSEHAAGCFFTDERLSRRFWAILLSPPTDFKQWLSLQEECYQLLVESIDNRYPRTYRLTDVRQLMGNICDNGLLTSPELPWLDVIAEQLLLRNGDLLYYREHKVQDYVRIAAELDPALLAGWRLGDWLQQSPPPRLSDITRVVMAQNPFFAPPASAGKPFAEGHVHLGGVTAGDTILDGYLFEEIELPKSNKTSLWAYEEHDDLTSLLNRAKSLLALLLSGPPQTVSEQSQNIAEYRERVSEKYAILNDPIKKCQNLPDWLILAKKNRGDENVSPGWLLSQLAHASDRKHPSRWLWLQLYLCHSYQLKGTHPLERTAILCFWLTVNALRRRIIMDGQGLTRFTERYFGGALRSGKKTDSSNMRYLFAGKDDMAEVKATPNAFSHEMVAGFSSTLLNTLGIPPISPPYVFGEHEIKPDERTLRYIEALERWQFCGHFSHSKSTSRGKRPTADLQNNWAQAEQLLQKLYSHNGWNHPVFLGGKRNQHFHFQPSNWFRGLDVAGDENALKIAGFAPMLRWLRSGLYPVPDGLRASTSFHFSIHAGEDYAHPASGLRHIDETVRFCEMREGDRLGHALALGIEPAFWAKRHGEMILPLDEHLDNLVWQWHYATVLSGSLPLAQAVLPLLERRIARFVARCDWCKERLPQIDSSVADKRASGDGPSLKNITPDTLYRAWLLRRNCSYRLQQLHGGAPLTSQEKCALPDWSTLSDKDSVAAQLYQQRHSRLLDDLPPQLVVVRVADEWSTQELIGLGTPGKLRQRISSVNDVLQDIDTPVELQFLHALQDYLLDRYDRKGLIIETNPTSNVYIARFKKHVEHPIFRWNPPDEELLKPGAEFNRYGLRRGPVRVLVNTDDPGIMPTTLRTEFLLLREAAIERGVSRTMAEYWLERLRLYGLEQFQRNHLNVFEVIN